MARKDGIETYYGNNRASKAIYGAILIFVFIAGVAHTGSAGGSVSMAIKTFVAALTIVFAEVYAEFIGERIKQQGRLTRAERRTIVNDAMAIASVSVWPSLIFLVSGTGLYTLKNAFIFALSYCLVILLTFSYIAARMSGMRKSRAFIVAAVTLVIGGAIIALKTRYGH